MDESLVSVVVCTYSEARLQELLAALDSLYAQTHKLTEIVVIVDHNPALLQKIGALVLPRVHVAPNSYGRGLSGARNTGIQLAAGQTIAFIDDDAVADPQWLDRLLSGYETDHVVGTGGHILPLWEQGAQPAWFPEEYLWVVGCSYRGMAVEGAIRNPIGCNMSFRSNVFSAVGGFDESLGRLGGRPVGCEETELSIRVRRRWPMTEIRFVAEALVFHRVPKSRVTIRYILSRCFSEGISKALVRRRVGRDALSSEATHVLRTLPMAVFHNLMAAARLRHVGASLGRVGVILSGAALAGVGFLWGMVVLTIRPGNRNSAPSRHET